MTRKIKISDKTIARLHDLADQGTKESIEEIENFIKSAKNEDEKGFAEIALSEASFHYYCPENKEEAHDYELCELIAKREGNHLTNVMKLEELEYSLIHAKLDEEVHIMVMEETENESWQYNCIPDIVNSLESQIEDLKDTIAYDEEWIAQAKSLIKVEKYKENLSDVLESFSEDINLYQDEDCDCCCEPKESEF